MKKIISTILVVFPFSVFAEGAWSPEAERYLKDNPSTKKEIANAIVAGKVILGMCPNEVIAAAGRPGPYKIVKDKKWKSNVPPPVVAMAQCENPDDSVIEFLFRNERQFESGNTFHVRFEKGAAVLIDQNGFSQ